MSGPRQPRLPWEPLWALAARRGITGPTSLAEALGVDVRDVHRWRADGGIPERSADRVAVALGLTPELVWGVEAWAEATAGLVERGDREDERERAAAEAKAAARRAKRAANKRRYRAANPDYAERQRAYRAAYYADAGDFERARQRRYYEANAERERARSRANYEATNRQMAAGGSGAHVA